MWVLTSVEMNNGRWPKTTLVAQIELTEWTLDAHLRHPSFVGLRDDRKL